MEKIRIVQKKKSEHNLDKMELIINGIPQNITLNNRNLDRRQLWEEFVSRWVLCVSPYIADRSLSINWCWLDFNKSTLTNWNWSSRSWTFKLYWRIIIEGNCEANWMSAVGFSSFTKYRRQESSVNQFASIGFSPELYYNIDITRIWI